MIINNKRPLQVHSCLYLLNSQTLPYVRFFQYRKKANVPGTSILVLALHRYNPIEGRTCSRRLETASGAQLFSPATASVRCLLTTGSVHLNHEVKGG